MDQKSEAQAHSALCDVAAACPNARMFDEIEQNIRVAVPGFRRKPCTEAIEDVRQCGISTQCGLDALYRLLGSVVGQTPKERA